MQVQSVMSSSPAYSAPEDALEVIAQQMEAHHTGIIPIGENNRLVGMITDRDIALRAVAKGKGPDTKARDIMTQEVLYCFEDHDVKDVLNNMKEQKVHRLIVLDNEKNKQLKGMISISDIAKANAQAGNDNEISAALDDCMQRDTRQAACCA